MFFKRVLAGRAGIDGAPVSAMLKTAMIKCVMVRLVPAYFIGGVIGHVI